MLDFWLVLCRIESASNRSWKKLWYVKTYVVHVVAVGKCFFGSSDLWTADLQRSFVHHCHRLVEWKGTVFLLHKLIVRLEKSRCGWILGRRSSEPEQPKYVSEQSEQVPAGEPLHCAVAGAVKCSYSYRPTSFNFHRSFIRKNQTTIWPIFKYCFSIGSILWSISSTIYIYHRTWPPRAFSRRGTRQACMFLERNQFWCSQSGAIQYQHNFVQTAWYCALVEIACEEEHWFCYATHIVNRDNTDLS